MFTHKTLTVMFTDISGFTKQTGLISRDELMSRLASHNALLTPIVAHFGGTIIKSIGDAFLITFESPTNALHCGLYMQHALRQFNQGKSAAQQIHIKVSVNSGEVTLTENDVFGDPVNVAAKIEKATEPDEVYFTESVYLAMNQAEVPSEFVTTFAPKGGEAPEIRLYKVLMDEADSRYQRVVERGVEAGMAVSSPSGLDLENGQVSRRKNRLLVMALGVACVLAGGAGVVLWRGGVPTPQTPAPLVTENGPAPSVTETPHEKPVSVPEGPSPVAKNPVPPKSADAQPAAPGSQDNPVQTKALAIAREVIQDPAQLKEQSHAVIERLSLAFGDATDDPRVHALLLAAIKSRIYWEARNTSFDSAGALLERYRSRFVLIADWSQLERERYLGGFHNFATDELRRQWRSVWSKRWQRDYAFLKSAAEGDPEFEFRLGVEFHEINYRLFHSHSQIEEAHIRNALQRKPELLDANRTAVLTVVRHWLESAQDEQSLARDWVRKHFYAELRPWLGKNLLANQSRITEVTPDFDWRQNCFALLAERNDLSDITDPLGYFRDNIEVFLKATRAESSRGPGAAPAIFVTRQQMRRLLERPMSQEDYRNFKRLLERTLAETGSASGPWAGNELARKTVLALIEDLGAAQSAHMAKAD